MPEDSPADQEAFEEILKAANATIRGEATALMDMNHESIKHMREMNNSLRDFKDRYCDIIDNIILAHAGAAKELAELYGDLIMAEQGIREISDEEFDEMEDDEDE